MDRILRRSLGVSETAPTDSKVKPAPPVASEPVDDDDDDFEDPYMGLDPELLGLKVGEPVFLDDDEPVVTEESVVIDDEPAVAHEVVVEDVDSASVGDEQSVEVEWKAQEGTEDNDAAQKPLGHDEL